MTRNDVSKTVKGQRRAPRLDSREQARQNVHGVAVGQVWEDNDARHQANGWGPRRLQVFALTELHAECYLVDREGKFSAGEDKRYRNGKPRRIRLDRFRPTSTGYRLVSPLLLSSDTPERSSEDVQLTQGVPGHPEHEGGCCTPERRLTLLARTPGDRHLVQGSTRNHQGDGEIGNVPADGIRTAATRLDQGVEQGRNDRVPEGRDSRQHVRSIEAAPTDGCLE